MHDVRIDHLPSIPLESYRERLDALACRIPPLPTEEVGLAGSLNRVLARDLVSRVSVPGFANSAMDGYAVRAGDLSIPAELDIVGEQPAGPARNLTLEDGQAIRIMTGAPVPTDADTVVPSEVTQEIDGRVRILEAVAPGANVRGVGEDVLAGTVVLTGGTRMGPRQIGAAAAIGAGRIEVRRPLRVAVISTGDELAAPGSDLVSGQIFESNSFLLTALASEAGMPTITFPGVDDRPERLAETFDQAAARADVILVSGGISVGKYDVVRGLLGDAPDSCFVRVAMQPGKPQGHGLWKGVPVLAFPGNPVSVFVSYHLFGGPFLQALAGEGSASPQMAWAVAGEGWKSPEGRRQFLPVLVEVGEEGPPRVTRAARLGSGSHLVTSLAHARALAVVDEAVTEVRTGDPVRMMEIR